MEAIVHLGNVQSPRHLDKLSEVAAWLDHNKFSCTLSVVDNKATLDIDEPGDERQAMEEVIQALVGHME